MLKLTPEDYPPGSAVRAQLEAAAKQDAALVERHEKRVSESAGKALRSEGKRPNRRLEDELQQALIKTADEYPMALLLDADKWPHLVRQTTLGNWLFHVPNGGFRGPKEAGILIGLGVRPGVWDLFLRLPVLRGGEFYGGLWMENKAGSNGLTDKQKKFGAESSAVGYAIAEIRTQQDFHTAVEAYLRSSSIVWQTRREDEQREG